MHKYLGIMALAMMSFYNIIEPDFEDWVEETGLGDLAEYLGEVAFSALMALILLNWSSESLASTGRAGGVILMGWGIRLLFGT